jgi:hypothetical protein
MSTDSSSLSSRSSLIHTGAFFRTLAPPLMVWVAIVAFVSFSGQPGVICVTPMAWLLALWSGGQYIRLTGGRGERKPLLGPALVGAALGVCMSVMFILVTAIALPAGSAPGEAAKAVLLDAIIGVGGILACAALSTFTGWLTLNRYRRQETIN